MAVMILLIPCMSPACCSGHRKQESHQHCLRLYLSGHSRQTGTHLHLSEAIPAFPLCWIPIKGHLLTKRHTTAPVGIIQILPLYLLSSWRHCSRSSHI